MGKIITKYLKSVTWPVWILLAIILVGIFLRTYHFREWLQFGPDQARDSIAVSNAIEGKSPFPLLGPLAGGTSFRLGPMVYYFQYVSTLIFGGSPEVMAFPDLLFSILTIPLAYFFLKKYFNIGTALALTSLISVSYFMVFNSRFESNPNSVPFFMLIFLYASLEMMEPKNKEVYRWPILFGLALGIGIQLHTLLILIMPVMALLILIFLRKKNLYSWKIFSIILTMAIFLNVGQIIHEVKTGGSNIHEFFTAIQKRSGAKDNIAINTYKIGVCTIAANTHLVSSLAGDEDCTGITRFQSLKKFDFARWLVKNDILLLSLIPIVFFSLIGYALLIFCFEKEENITRKHFLGIIMLFAAVSFLAFIPVAGEISLRYFNMMSIIPFVLFGLAIQKLLSFKKEWIKITIVATFILLFFLNGKAEAVTASHFFAKNVNDSKNSILGETEVMARYIVDNADGKKTVYFTGKKDYARRFFKPLEYLTKDIELSDPEKEVGNINPSLPVFYVVKSEEEKYNVGMKIGQYTIKKMEIFNNITILILSDYAKNRS